MVKSDDRMLMAPHQDIAACPSSWYLVERSARLRPGEIRHISVGDHGIVLFRGHNDRAVHALAAHCAHMGCHLKGGAVIGDRLRCPLHFRQIDAGGTIHAATGGKPPAQRTYPVIERYGAIFVFVGRWPEFEFPAPHRELPERFIAAVTRSMQFALPWYALTANGCDLDHLQAVHLRRLKEPPQFGPLGTAHFELRYRSEVVGNALADRAMKRMSGNDIRATVTAFGGSLVLVETTLRRGRTFLLLSMRPCGDGVSVRAVVGVARSGNALWDRLRIRLAAWLFQSFLRRDLAVLDGLRLHRPDPPLSESDRCLSLLFDYFQCLDRPLQPALSQGGER